MGGGGGAGVAAGDSQDVVRHAGYLPCENGWRITGRGSEKGEEPISSKYGTHQIVKARFWPWLSGKILRLMLERG